MADHTDEVTTACEIDVVFALDVLDTRRRLAVEHVSFAETLAQCGCGPQKCAILEKWINKRRVAIGRDPLKGGTIKSTTTMKEVVGHVC